MNLISPIVLIKQSGRECPLCGSKPGDPGCPECYRFFADELKPALTALYGAPTHRGEVPRRFDERSKRERRIAELKAELAAAVAAEEFERACGIRDSLRLAQNETEAARNGLV
ncbi:MAG: UvrB/UvrC motif-containing protein [Candidatus Flemingiibacterium sp.]